MLKPFFKCLTVIFLLLLAFFDTNFVPTAATSYLPQKLKSSSLHPSENDVTDKLEEILHSYLAKYAKDHDLSSVILQDLTIEDDRAYAVALVNDGNSLLSMNEVDQDHEVVGGKLVKNNAIGFVLDKYGEDNWSITPANHLVAAQDINIPVPFSPQVPPGVWASTKNCGQTSSAMVFAYYGFYNHSPANSGDITSINSWLAQEYSDNRYLDSNGYYTSTTILTNLAKSYANFGKTYNGSSWTITQLKQEIQAGRPVIIATYTNMDTVNGVKHFMVLRGLRLDNNGNVTHVIVNDPGRSLASGRGENIAYDVATFEAAWAKNGKAVVVIVNDSNTPTPTCSAPSNGIPRDNFVSNNNQVTFTWSPPACDGIDGYTFRVSEYSDIDNQPWIINHGVSKDSTSVTETIPSQHNGKTLYWAIWPHNSAGNGARGGPWVFKIDTSVPAVPPPLPSNQWNVQYFRNKELNDQCATTTFTRPFIFMDWGDGAPAGGCNSDHWSARFSKNVYLQGGNYTFAIKADDWGRIYVGSDLVVNKWNGASQVYESRSLPAGNYDIKVEFADTLGGAKLSAWWWGPGFNVPHETQDPNQWFANYWINDTMWEDSFANVNEGSGILNHQWGSNSPGWDMPGDKFSAKFQRTVNFECGDYRFMMDHDDGANFYLDDVLKLPRWTGAIGYTETILPVTRGPHLLRIEYYENGGSAGISFNWQQLSSCNPPAPTLQSPSDSNSLAWNTDMTFGWNTSANATQYLVQLQGGPGVDTSSGWISATQWNIGGLWPGVYTWTVTARNDYGSSAPSAARTFAIQEPPLVVSSINIFLPAIQRTANGQWETAFEGFEGAFPGSNWQLQDVSGSGYLWKDVFCNVKTGMYSGWMVGGGVNGLSDCNSEYPHSIRTRLVYGPFNMSYATAANLNFQLWLNSESGYDFLRWGFSTDGTNYQTSSLSGQMPYWQPVSANLASFNGTNYIGQPEVWLMFEFQSDGSISYPGGAFLDDISLQKCTGGVCY